MLDAQFHVALYVDELDADPRIAIKYSWASTVELLTHPECIEESPCTVEDGPNKCKGKKCPHKRHSTTKGNKMVWLPVEIEGRRSDDNVKSISLLVLDFDDLTIEETKKTFTALVPYDHIKHTTHSHRGPEAIYFRAVIALSRPVHANQWHRFHAAALAFLDVPADPVCKNRSRPFFRPSHPKDAPHEEEYVQGKVLDVDAVLAWADVNLAPAAPIAARQDLPAASSWDLEGDSVVGLIGAAARYFPPQRRHELCMALAGMLRMNGATEDDAKYIVRQVAEEGGSDNPEARAKTVEHTYALSDESWMTGFTRVSEIIGADAARDLGEFINDARREIYQRAFERNFPERAKEFFEPIPPSPADIDFKTLREITVKLATKKARSIKRDDKILAILLRRVLKNERLAVPGGVGDVETVPDGEENGVGRGKAVRRVVWALAYAFPPGTPWDAAAEIVRPSFQMTEADPGQDWMTVGEREFVRAQQKYAIEAAERAMREAERSEAARAEAIDEALPSGAPPDGEKWIDKLSKGANGSIAQTPANARIILRNHSDFCGKIVWNEITKTIELRGMKLKISDTEDIVAWIQDYLAGAHSLQVAYNDLKRRVFAVARENPYDPLREYLLSLSWDGKKRLKTWLADYCGARNDDSSEARHIRNIGRRWLIACVARALQPGCKCDTMLIFESDRQGVGKSTAFDILGGQWFCDTSIDVRNKDSRLMVASSWIIEMPELQSFKMADYLRMKAFLSQRSDIFRPPYGDKIETFKRRAAFAGTTNERVYLTDNTGNRRYWSVFITKIDTEALEVDRDQLFAEAVHLYLTAETCEDCMIARGKGTRNRCDEHRWWLSDSEEEIAEEEAEKREEEIPWTLQIHEWWLNMKPEERPEYISTDDLAKFVLDIPLDRVNNHLRTQIGIATKSLNFTKKKITVGGKQHWFYVPSPQLLKAPQVKKKDRISRTLYVVPKTDTVKNDRTN